MMKPLEQEMFDSPDDVLRFARCAKCGERINRWGGAIELDRPDVYGQQTQEPWTFTHTNTVECKNGCTKINVLGAMRKYSRAGCMMQWVEKEPWKKKFSDGKK